MLTRIKILPVARRNYCIKIKPPVYVHAFTSISVLQNSLSNTTSLTALEMLQLLLQLLFNSSHFCALLLLKLLDLVIHDTCCVCSAFSAYSSADAVNQYQSAGIFSSFEAHQVHRSTVCASVLFHYIPVSSFHLPCRISISAWQKRLPTRDVYHHFP